MSSLLSPLLRQRLGRSRLITREAQATTGVGERPSRGRGPGIEFADYRIYQPGDDFRHLDRHVYARLRQNVIRQYALDRQLSVAIMVDASASMNVGTPSKLRRASELAAVLCYVTLTGGDQVQVGSFSDEGIDWFPRAANARALPGLLEWLERAEGTGESDLRRSAIRSMSHLRPHGLLVVISDWLLAGVDDALALWTGKDQEIVAIQVLAPEEEDPANLPEGQLRLRDLENGNSLEGTFDLEVVDQYRRALAELREEVRTQIARRGGRWLTVSTDDDLQRIVLDDWRRKGLFT